MTRPTLNLKMALENLHCYDEGDGWGNAEPYLWPVFFKIDGDNYAVVPGSGLIGFPVIQSRSGDHGNLGDTDVDAGDDVPIPESLGTFDGVLKPIPIYDPFIKSLIGDDLPGIAGVAVVVMEEDGWPNDVAVAGYSAFVNAIRLAVAQVAASFQHATSAPTKDEIDAAIQTVKDSAAAAVRGAILNFMSGGQIFWYGTFGNNDDTIGSEVWTFTHDDFAADAVIDFSRHWGSDEAGDGDWEISGSAIGVVPCPADALAGLFRTTSAKRMAGGSHGEIGVAGGLAAMREFRACGYRDLPGLALWWKAFQSGAADLVAIARKDTSVQAAMARLFAAIPEILAAPHEPMAEDHLADLRVALEGMERRSSWFRRGLTRRALKILPEIAGMSFNQATRHVAGIRPVGRMREYRKATRS